jgi:hypothetical protein
MKRTRGPYKQYTVNGSSGIPRRTEYRERQRLLIEVNSEQVEVETDCEAVPEPRPELSELRSDLEQDKVLYLYEFYSL